MKWFNKIARCLSNDKGTPRKLSIGGVRCDFPKQRHYTGPKPNAFRFTARLCGFVIEMKNSNQRPGTSIRQCNHWVGSIPRPVPWGSESMASRNMIRSSRKLHEFWIHFLVTPHLHKNRSDKTLGAEWTQCMQYPHFGRRSS